MTPRAGAERAGTAVTVLVAGLAMVAACAKNPVSGRRQMMLISEEQEFAIGRGADAEIRRQYGVYLDSPALRAYVDRVGTPLAGRSDRPDLTFHFEILDTSEINAFALPGGFVYITRGMLERLSSEDELAMVLGHEIGHVTARHGAARISTLYALQYGSLIGAVISPRTFANYNDLIGLALQVALSKYSREQESQADRLGVSYAAGAGYRPEGAMGVIRILEWLEGEEPEALEKWFLSHPPAAERMADIEAEISALEAEEPAVAGRPSLRDPYLTKIEGLVVGQYNGAEMLLRDRYYNKELAISLPVPPGWEVNLDPPDAVMSMTRGKGEFLMLDAEPMRVDVDAARIEQEFDRTLRKRGWERTGGWADDSSSPGSRFATYEGRTSRGEPIGILNAFFAGNKRRWTVTAVSSLESFDEGRRRYEHLVAGVRFLGEEEAGELRPPRLTIIEVTAGSTWESLARDRLGDPEAARRLAFYNGMPPDSLLTEGFRVKVPPALAARPR